MTSTLIGPRVRPDVSPDAVVVVPGIMGSTLESADGVLWGLHRLRWYLKEWTRWDDSALDQLRLTRAEREGDFGRIHATGLLRAPAWAPFLQGIEPYGALVDGIRDVVVHQDAVLEFAYDWRLPCAYNASILANSARKHLATWRVHREYERFHNELPDSRPPRLVIVAHSMGGLLARSLPEDLDVRATITLGTPFDGAAKAALILNTGEGAPLPLPKPRLQAMARTLPGLHDLLPTYRCLDGGHEADPVRLSPEDVATLGGDAELATQSFDWHKETSARRLPGHRALIGINQPTASSLTLRGGVIRDHPETFELMDSGFARDSSGFLHRILKHGDGTVPDNSAHGEAVDQPVLLSQQHGPIAKSSETIDFVRAVLRERPAGVGRLGEDHLSLDIPDLVLAGDVFTVPIGGITGPRGARVAIYDEDGRRVARPGVHRADLRYQVRVGPLSPGIFEVVVSRGSMRISQRVMVIDSQPSGD